jgi:hypothetical protein
MFLKVSRIHHNSYSMATLSSGLWKKPRHKQPRGNKFMGEGMPLVKFHSNATLRVFYLVVVSTDAFMLKVKSKVVSNDGILVYFEANPSQHLLCP